MPRLFHRRSLLAIALLAPVTIGGCGWEPLYADRQTGPADAGLRAIRVQPIAERIGQKLQWALRSSLNPGGEAAPQRYTLITTLSTARSDLGVLTQGIGTRGRLDVVASYELRDIRTNELLLQGRSHDAQSFDILGNEYSNIVAEEDARDRAVEELRRDIVTRLALYMQRRTAENPAKS